MDTIKIYFCLMEFKNPNDLQHLSITNCHKRRATKFKLKLVTCALKIILKSAMLVVTLCNGMGCVCICQKD